MSDQPNAEPADGAAALHRRRTDEPVDVRRRNFSLLLRQVLARGPVARADLAAATGLTTGTVTKLTAILGEAGLLQELAPASRAAASLGRPRVPVAVDPDRFRVVGVHIGLLRTNLCLINLRGEVIRELKIGGRDHQPEAVLSKTIEAIGTLTADNSGSTVAVGVSTGGWVDAARGVIVDHAVLGWRNVPIAERLTEELGLPVEVDSSFRALALAEHWLGESAGATNLIHLSVGNVVGAGFLLDGRLYRGSTSAAGALDHLAVGGRAAEPCRCGRRDCLHVVASDLAVKRRAQAEGLLSRSQDVDKLVDLARSGVARADQLLSRRARQVGTAAGVLADLFDPDVVIIGGGVMAAPEYLDEVRAGAHRYLSDKRDPDVTSLVRATSFGPQTPSVPSATVALAAVYSDPARFVPGLRDLRYG